MNDLPPDDLALLKQAADGCDQLQQQIGRIIIGQKEIVESLLAALLAEGHTLIVGVPGLAKTLLAKTLAQTLGWSFNRLQFTPDMMPADITGMELLQQNKATGQRAMQFVPGPIFANLILGDEINRTPPKTQAALLEAMQERHITSMGQQHALDRPFIVVATQNPIEQEGTYPLPEAQLDRFMFSLWMDYPPVEEEEAIVQATTAPRDESVASVFTKEQMIAFQQLVRRVPASKHVVRYAVALARATRPNTQHASDFVNRYVQWGAGPRAGQMMILGSKALAVMHGDPTATPEHVRRVAPMVLRHRVLPNYQASGEGYTADQVVQTLINEIAPPVGV